MQTWSGMRKCTTPFILFEEVKNMSRGSTRNKKKSDLRGQIIVRQVDKIDSLQKQVNALEIDNAKKDEIINSINALRDDLFSTINELKGKSEKYDELLAELMQMRKVMNQTVFKGRWKLIRLLLK